MDTTTTTTDEDLAAMSAAEPAAAIPPRAKPRKLTMTDKIVEARDLNLKKAERLKERADRLRQELARCVAELNETRAEVGRGNAALPLEQRRGGELATGGPTDTQFKPDPSQRGDGGVGVERFQNGAAPDESAP